MTNPKEGARPDLESIKLDYQTYGHIASQDVGIILAYIAKLEAVEKAARLFIKINTVDWAEVKPLMEVLSKLESKP